MAAYDAAADIGDGQMSAPSTVVGIISEVNRDLDGAVGEVASW